MRSVEGGYYCSDRAGAVTDRVPGGVEPTTKLLVKGGGGGLIN